MANKIRVVIGGREYSLRVEDESFVKQSAEELNWQIQEIENKYKDESSITITTLAALNLVEKKSKEADKQEKNKLFVLNEINKMTEFLNSRIDN